MLDLKVINSVLAQLEEERGIPRAKVIEAIELALGTAYRKEYGKRDQVVTASFNMETGEIDFQQVKMVVDRDTVAWPKEGETEEDLLETTVIDPENPDAPAKERWNPERHILIEDARLLKRDAAVGDEIAFPLERREDFGRIAAQTAKQVITQKIREAERQTVMSDYGLKEGEIVSGSVERVERGSLFLQMGRATGYMPWAEQIPGERFRQGERVRALLLKVEEGNRGVFLRISRAHPKFLVELFKEEVPEVKNGVVEVVAVAREAGQRSKIAVRSKDAHVDPIGALVGARGVRVSTVTSELAGEKIDIIEWSPDEAAFIQAALSPAKCLSVDLDRETRLASILVAEDQLSLAIGRGGQNVRLAAKLTGWRIDIKGFGSPAENEANEVREAAPTDDGITEGEADEEMKAAKAAPNPALAEAIADANGEADAPAPEAAAEPAADANADAE
jgi:N utilization substance protein A